MDATKTVKQFKSWSGMDYYQKEITALWDDFKVCNLFFYMNFYLTMDLLILLSYLLKFSKGYSSFQIRFSISE